MWGCGGAGAAGGGVGSILSTTAFHRQQSKGPGMRLPDQLCKGVGRLGPSNQTAERAGHLPRRRTGRLIDH